MCNYTAAHIGAGRKLNMIGYILNASVSSYFLPSHLEHLQFPVCVHLDGSSKVRLWDVLGRQVTHRHIREQAQNDDTTQASSISSYHL